MSETECLNCAAPLGGAYCSACGQRAVDLAAPTWVVVREGVSEAIDLDGRVLNTLRALVAPGRLTADFLRGRRAPYLGPLKLFFAAGAALSTTWALTRGIDAHFYGFDSSPSAAEYIAKVVRGSLAAVIAVALVSWLAGACRRRLLDEGVFALYLVAALSLLATIAIWLGTFWKLVWGTARTVPDSIPNIAYLLFAPAALVGFWYIIASTRRVHQRPWIASTLRASALAAIGLAATLAFVLRA